MIGEILDGIGDLLGVGRTPSEPSGATPSPRVRPLAGPSATARPGRPPADPAPGCAATPRRSRAARRRWGGKVLPRIAADAGQPVVAATPSKLTGSKVTMTGLRFEGIVDLPTADGTLKVLKFSMDRAVTDDFLLASPGPAGRTMRFATDRLTVKGDVAFYATRFVGRLLGIKITLTPDLPFPDGIPITVPIPITFTDPVIDLAFVDQRHPDRPAEAEADAGLTAGNTTGRGAGRPFGPAPPGPPRAGPAPYAAGRARASPGPAPAGGTP